MEIGRRTAALVVAATLAAAPAAGRTWIVERDGSGDAPTIHAAILMATAGDVIDVGPGTYDEFVYLTGGRDILLRGRLGAASTIIDGGALQMDAGTIDGFTLRNAPTGVAIGQANTVTNPILRNCIIEHNTGPGIWNFAIGARIESNIIRHNDAGWKSVGGGIRCDGSDAVIISNLIAFNRAMYAGGGIFAVVAFISENVIVGNQGGGVYLGACEFRNNTVYGNSGVITNGVDAGSSCTVEANIIVRNQHIGLMVSDNSTVGCNNVWGNGSDEIVGPADPTNFAADPLFCATDPAATLNFLLRSDSPCAPSLSPGGQCSLVGAAPVGCGTVAIQPATWSSLKRLFR